MIMYAKNLFSLAYFYKNQKSEESKKYFCHSRALIYSGLSCIGLFALSFPVYAEQDIKVPMDLSKWIYNGNQFECKLTHTEVAEGKFYFRALPNNKLFFQIDLSNINKKFVSGELYYQAPPWAVNSSSVPLSSAKLDEKQSARFLQGIDELLLAMQTGHWIKLSLSGNKTSASQALILPTMQAADAISRFTRCRDNLPAMSYSEARDVVLSFAFGQRNLSTAQTRRLKALTSYLKADKRVTRILIDGYTDSVGSTVSNLDISRQRAELVAAELKTLGVKPEMLEVRAHGARYPLATNKTEQGRAKNRRVTLRLVRDNESVVPAASTETVKVQ